MTLQELLAQYGIKRPSDLALAAQIDRRHAWMIWHGTRRIGHKLALRLYESKGIPIHDLLRAELKAPVDTPKGRPRRKCPDAP